jgi:hypothetical protein
LRALTQHQQHQPATSFGVGSGSGGCGGGKKSGQKKGGKKKGGKKNAIADDVGGGGGNGKGVDDSMLLEVATEYCMLFLGGSKWRTKRLRFEFEESDDDDEESSDGSSSYSSDEEGGEGQSTGNVAAVAAVADGDCGENVPGNVSLTTTRTSTHAVPDAAPTDTHTATSTASNTASAPADTDAVQQQASKRRKTDAPGMVEVVALTSTPTPTPTLTPTTTKTTTTTTTTAPTLAAAPASTAMLAAVPTPAAKSTTVVASELEHKTAPLPPVERKLVTTNNNASTAAGGKGNKGRISSKINGGGGGGSKANMVVWGGALDGCLPWRGALPWKQSLDMNDTRVQCSRFCCYFGRRGCCPSPQQDAFNPPHLLLILFPFMWFAPHAAQATGRWGEALVYQYLLASHPHSTVVWENEKEETKAPFDLKLTHREGKMLSHLCVKVCVCVCLSLSLSLSFSLSFSLSLT